MVKTFFFFFLMGGNNSQKWQVVASSYTLRTSMIFELMLYSNRDQFRVHFYGSHNFLAHLLILNYIKLLLQTIRGKEKYIVQCKKKPGTYTAIKLWTNTYHQVEAQIQMPLGIRKSARCPGIPTLAMTEVLKPEVSLQCRFWLCSPEVGPKLLHLLKKGQRKTQVIGPQTMLWRQRSKERQNSRFTWSFCRGQRTLNKVCFSVSLPRVCPNFLAIGNKHSSICLWI